MNALLCDVLRRHARPTAPIPTEMVPRLARIPGIRAVLFDIYGTLFVSASGDVGTAKQAANTSAFSAALEAVGSDSGIDGQRGLSEFFATIEESHDAAKSRGIEFPEVDIVQVWGRTLARIDSERSPAGLPVDEGFLRRLAVEYEARANPVWPMPGLAEELEEVLDRGILLGLVSNAQFFTPLLFEAFLGRSVDACGFASDLRFYSYAHGFAKPGDELFLAARRALAGHGIEPCRTLFVGNDMVNDVAPAHRVGFRTALFAGDARSLRRRKGDDRCLGIVPDLILTDLDQCRSCLVATPFAGIED